MTLVEYLNIWGSASCNLWHELLRGRVREKDQSLNIKINLKIVSNYTGDVFLKFIRI